MSTETLSIDNRTSSNYLECFSTFTGGHLVKETNFDEITFNIKSLMEKHWSICNRWSVKKLINVHFDHKFSFTKIYIYNWTGNIYVSIQESDCIQIHNKYSIV